MYHLLDTREPELASEPELEVEAEAAGGAVSVINLKSHWKGLISNDISKDFGVPTT